MPSQLRLTVGPVVFTPPYFDELVRRDTNPKGRLPKDIEAHALWYYFTLASKNLLDTRENIVYEDELSKNFTPTMARKLMESIAFMYGSAPQRMVRYWEAVEMQRVALGFSTNTDLPPVFKFRLS